MSVGCACHLDAKKKWSKRLVKEYKKKSAKEEEEKEEEKEEEEKEEGLRKKKEKKIKIEEEKEEEEEGRKKEGEDLLSVLPLFFERRTSIIDLRRALYTKERERKKKLKL